MIKLLKTILERNIAPRWFIFLLDISIMWFVFLFTTIMISHDGPITNIIIGHFYQFISSAVIFILAYLIVKPHHNIIRHSTIQDFITIIVVQFLASIGLLIYKFNFQNFFANQYELLYSEIIIHFFISGFILIFLRILFRYISSYLLQGPIKTRKTLIFGAGRLGLMARSIIERDDSYNYNIIGFIDDNPNLVGKRMEGIPVYSVSRTFKHVIREQNINDIIIAVNEFEITKEKKAVFINQCLEKHIKVKEIQEISAWLNFPRRKASVQNIKIDDLLGREPISMDIRKISNGLSGKTVLVTGAAGSIGSEIVRQIMEFKPRKLLMVDQAESELFKIQNEIKTNFKNSNSIEVIVANITDSYRMRKVFSAQYPDIVYHASAYKHVPLMEDHPYEAVKNNIGGTKIIADLSVEFEVDKFVMISTDKAVNPTNVMGASKRICEIYVQSLSQLDNIKTQFITTRFGNVLGSNGSVVPIFKKQIEKGGPVTITHKDITRYFMTIPEASQLVLEAGFMGSGGEIFLFDMGKPVRIYDLAEKMISLAGYEPHKDVKIVVTGLRPGEKLYEELLANRENCKSTPHDKIMIAKGRSQIYEEVNNKISEMLFKLNNEPDEMIVARMKDLVPEFFSQNSRFEKLDFKINIFDFEA